MIGKSSIRVLLAIINAFSDANEKYSHCSVVEINTRFGLSLKNIPEMFRQLEKDGYIEDCTVSGFYKRFRILKTYPCPDFILDNRLNNPQKNFLLRCIEKEVNDTLSKKEICRRLTGGENLSNLNTIINKINKATGKDLFEILNNITYITGLVPTDAIYTKFGYRSTVSIQHTKECSEEDKISNYLHSKSFEGFKHRKNIIEYTLTPEIIKKQLLKQDMKDYYTGVVPKNYEEYSIDRIDSSKGYVEDNIVITTGVINTMKLDMSIEEFKEQIKLLYNNMSNF